MPRKALALERAALRFAQAATDECGRGQQADNDRLPCNEARPGSKEHQSDLHHQCGPARRYGTTSPRQPRLQTSQVGTCAPWTKHVLLFLNSAVAAAHPGKPSHSRRSERSNGLQDPLEHG